MKTFLLILGVLFASCSMKTRETALQDQFAAIVTKHYPVLKKGNQLLFIINKPECSPCIEAIRKTIAADYPAGKNAIHFGNAPIELPHNLKILTEEEHLVAQYGLLGVDGTICVFTAGRLRALPFDTKNPSKAIAAIRKALKKKERSYFVSFRQIGY